MGGKPSTDSRYVSEAITEAASAQFQSAAGVVGSGCVSAQGLCRYTLGHLESA